MVFTPTKEQEAIINHPKGVHARVLAGPGTGKSATLVALIDRLLSSSSPPRTKLLTFTRAATGELAKKVSAHPKAAAERPSTIHSFAISVLLQNPGVGDFPSPLRIADDWERDNIVYPTLARRIQVKKNRLRNLFRELASNFEALCLKEDQKVDPKDRARFLGGWQEHRKVYGYTLLSELPYALMCGLRDHPDMKGVEYDLLVVDEYQDLNSCDLQVIKLLSERDCSIIGAGDDDQSIYSFRRAAPEGIRRFPTDYTGCSDYPLSITHRCGSRIIEWASFVIEGDLDRPKDKERLTCMNGSPSGQVALLSFAGQVREAKGIAKLVKVLIESKGVLPSEILILLRSDHNATFSKPIKEALADVDVPYSDPDEVKRVLGERDNRLLIAYIRLLIQKYDSLAWATILNLQPGIGTRICDYIYNRACMTSQSFGGALLSAYESNFPDCSRAQANKVKSLMDLIINWIDTMTIPDETDQGWGHWMGENAGAGLLPSPSANFRDILYSLDAISESDQGLERYLNQITPLARDRAQTEDKGVRIMTMSASKGLTVEATIIGGLENEIIPRLDAPLAEERRLLYVAMTRARKYLFGTWARRRSGPTARAGQSRVVARRNMTSILRGGPVESKDGDEYLKFWDVTLNSKKEH